MYPDAETQDRLAEEQDRVAHEMAQIAPEMYTALQATTANLRTLYEMMEFEFPSTARVVMENIKANEKTLAKIAR